MPSRRGVTLPVLWESPDEDRAWMVDAACSDPAYPPRLWFPSIRDERYPGGRRAWETPLRTAAARRICRVCPVRELCLAAALRRREPVGVWGGLSTKDRQALLRQRNVA